MFRSIFIIVYVISSHRFISRLRTWVSLLLFQKFEPISHLRAFIWLIHTETTYSSWAVTHVTAITSFKFFICLLLHVHVYVKLKVLVWISIIIIKSAAIIISILWNSSVHGSLANFIRRNISWLACVRFGSITDFSTTYTLSPWIEGGASGHIYWHWRSRTRKTKRLVNRRLTPSKSRLCYHSL